MGKKKAIKQGKYSQSEDRYLRLHYPDTMAQDIAEHLHRSLSSVRNRAERLGIKKSKKFMQACGYNVCKRPNSIATRFPKGHESHSKGKRREEYMTDDAIRRMEATQFKKGCTPHNKKPVGYEKMHACGYIYVKTAENSIMRPKHAVVWEQIHGMPIPDGMVVCFADGDRTNFSPSNLVLRTRSEAVRMYLTGLSPEERNARQQKATAARNERIRKDKMRIRWGLEPTTKLVKHYYPK